MTADTKVDWGRLADYFVGVIAPADRVALEEWIAADPDHRVMVERMRQLWADAAMAPPVDADAGWEAVAQRLTPPANQATLPPAPRRVSMSTRTVGRRSTVHLAAVAAAVLIAATATLALTLHLTLRALGRTYATGPAERETVTLSDGSRVTLGPESQVRLAPRYGTDVRDVTLEGEAYFAVVHDAAHPFAVRAHGAVARDVGTAFDVRAYPEDAGARIAVAEGAVAVAVADGCPVRTGAAIGGRAISAVGLPHLLATRDNASAQTHAGSRAGHDRRRGLAEVRGGPSDGGMGEIAPISASEASALPGRRSRPAPRNGDNTGGPCIAEARAGDVATIGQSRVTVEHRADVASLTSWRTGQLAFADEPVADVVRELARWYGVRVELGDAVIGTRPYTATLDGESVAEAVDAVCRSVVGRYERRGERYVLYAAGGR